MSKFKLYIETGIKAEKATGIEERIITTLSGKPPSIFPYPKRKAAVDTISGTNMNFIIEITMHSLVKSLTLPNFIANPIETNIKIVWTGITTALRVL